MSDVTFRMPETVEIKRPQPRIVWPLLVFAAIGVGAVVLAVATTEGIERLVLASFGLWFLLVTWGFSRLMDGVQYRELRVSTDASQLAFVPRRSIERMDDIVAGALLVPWAFIVIALFTDQAATVLSGFWPTVALVGIPVIFGYYLWQLRRPRGLALQAQGIHGVRRGPKLSLSWEDVAGVAVADLPGRGRLLISVRSGKVVKIDSTRFGSDARAVAAVIEHFRANERERSDLAQGADALARFGATKRA